MQDERMFRPDVSNSFSLAGESVLVTSAKNYLYVVNNQNSLSRFNCKGVKEGNRDVYINLDNPNYMQVDDTKAIIAQPAEASYTLAIVPTKLFSDPQDFSSEVSVVNIEAAKGAAKVEASRIQISANLNYLVFSVNNEIYEYRETDGKFKLAGSYKQLEEEENITNLFVTNSGSVYFTTESGSYFGSIPPSKFGSKMVVNKIHDGGAKEGMACVTANDIFCILEDKKLYYFVESSKKDHTKSHIDIPGDNKVISFGALQNYVYISYDKEATDSFVVIDIKYSFFVFKGNFGRTKKYAIRMWGALVLILDDLKVDMFEEYKPIDKVKNLTKRSQYDTALKMATDYNLSPQEIADIHREYGDYYFNEKKAYNEAIEQYKMTIGYVEPSHVIEKFVEPHLAEFLAQYLQAIPSELKSKQHTTLLFNCFTKVKNEEMLENVVNGFVEEAKNNEVPSFDVETAVDVLSKNGYKKLAGKLAKAYDLYYTYMDLLYENQEYEQMLEYIKELPGEYVSKKLSEYGAEIIAKYQDGRQEFIEYATKCCTEGIKNKRNDDITYVDPDALAPIFVNSPKAHFDFLYGIKDKAVSFNSWNTLLELAIRINSDKLPELINTPEYSREQILIYLNAYGNDKYLKNIYKEMNLYPFLLHMAKPEEIRGICEDYGNECPELWNDGLIEISESDCNDEVLADFLDALAEKNCIPFLTVITILKSHGKHTIAAAQKYIKDVFSKEQDLLRKANEEKKKNAEALEAEEEETKTLNDNFTVLYKKKCEICDREIVGRDAVHFLCGHSYHASCLEQRTICTKCHSEYEYMVREKIKMIQSTRNNTEDIPEDGYQALLKDIGNSIFPCGISLADEEEEDELKEAESFLERIANSV